MTKNVKRTLQSLFRLNWFKSKNFCPELILKFEENSFLEKMSSLSKEELILFLEKWPNFQKEKEISSSIDEIKIENDIENQILNLN